MVRMICCGKGLHVKCYEDIFASSMSAEQKNRCVMCRAKFPVQGPAGSKERIKQIRQSVEKGKAWAQSMLAENYTHGIDVDQSYQRAKELNELAASQGYADAQNNLGSMYESGQGVDQSYARAAEYYKTAAKQGSESAQNNLGCLYKNGLGVERSCETACVWWIKSAEQGNETAIKNLQRLDKQEGRRGRHFRLRRTLVIRRSCNFCSARRGLM